MTAARAWRRRLAAGLLAAPLVLPLVHAPALAADALDAEESRASGATDVPTWWSLPGGPGWVPGTDLGGGFPWAYAGHAIGAWTLDERLRASLRAPLPGVSSALPPLVWTEGISVRWLGDAAWSGPGAGMMRVTDSVGVAPAGTRARSSMFSFSRGSSAEDRNALRLVQHDSARTIIAEVAEWRRGGTGVWEQAGAHLYGFGFSTPWRRARLEATFGQRGSAGSVTSGEEESVTGFGGFARVLAPIAGGDAVIELGRDMDQRDSQGGVMLPGHRDAQRTRGEASWTRAHAGGSTGARVRFARSEVVQSVPGVGREEWEDDELWFAVRHRRPWAGGSLDATLGAGSSSAVGLLGPSPQLAWEGSVRGAGVRLVAGRAVTPQWSDLAPGFEAFVQSSWSAGADLAFGRPGRRVLLGAQLGSTGDRAIVTRLPIAAWWLREGVTRDGEPWNFALGTLGLAWSGAPGALTADVFGLARQASAAQPQVDPALGARATAEVHRKFFVDDLDFRLRGAVAWVGERESEASQPRRLPGYATFNAALVLSIADVTAVTEMRAIEDVRRPEVWIDPVTGVEALGPGREYRFMLSWRLFD